MSFISKDRDLVETFRRCLQLVTPVRTIRTRTGGTVYRVQWCDRRLYDWFIALGLTPAKSLRLGPLDVPDECLADVFRGCIDGDGTVLVYTDRSHAMTKDRYVYERLYVSLVSASPAFIEWIQAGFDMQRPSPSGSSPGCTNASDVPCLLRKRVIAEKFLSPLGFAPVQPVGRPRAGWRYNVGAARLGQREDRAGVEKRQTRGAQNAVSARACGFKSRPRHQPPLPRLP
jgi:hypothetical protein